MAYYYRRAAVIAADGDYWPALWWHHRRCIQHLTAWKRKYNSTDRCLPRRQYSQGVQFLQPTVSKLPSTSCDDPVGIYLAAFMFSEN